VYIDKCFSFSFTPGLGVYIERGGKYDARHHAIVLEKSL
jgi:hypothetical protein